MHFCRISTDHRSKLKRNWQKPRVPQTAEKCPLTRFEWYVIEIAYDVVFDLKSVECDEDGGVDLVWIFDRPNAFHVVVVPLRIVWRSEPAAIRWGKPTSANCRSERVAWKSGRSTTGKGQTGHQRLPGTLRRTFNLSAVIFGSATKSIFHNSRFFWTFRSFILKITLCYQCSGYS